MFDTECVAIGPSVDFLAMSLSTAHGVVHARPRSRPHDLPLTPSSAHPVASHASWAVSFVHGLGLLCNRGADHQCCIDSFYRCLFNAGWPQHLLHRIRSTVDHAPSRLRTKQAYTWLVLPFHPLWEKSEVRQQVAAFLSDPFWVKLLH